MIVRSSAALLAALAGLWTLPAAPVAPAAKETPTATKTCEPAEPLPPIPSTAAPNSTYLAAGKPIPQRFRHGAVGVRIRFASADEVNRICANQPSGLPVCGRTFFACIDEHGTMFMPNPCDSQGEGFADLLCHETAHLRGWPAEHGD